MPQDKDANESDDENENSNNHHDETVGSHGLQPPRTTFTVTLPKKRSNALWKAFFIPTMLAVAVAVILLPSSASSTAAESFSIHVLQTQWSWIVSGVLVAIIVLETVQHFSTKTKKAEEEQGNVLVDLVLTICPLGIQRSLVRSRTPMMSNNEHHHHHHHHHPLLPAECIHDCILLEHVGAFSVSTHVMLRVRRRILQTKEEEDEAASSSSTSAMFLVEAFPNAQMTFEECRNLQKQIQASLEGIKKR